MLVRWNPTDVSEKRTTSIFRVEEEAKQVTNMKQAVSCHLLHVWIVLRPEDGGEMPLRNIRRVSTVYKAYK
jgi:hypothetical protein